MFSKFLAAAAAAAMAAAPSMAAELPSYQDPGVRRSGAVAAVYYKVPLGGGTRAKGRRGGMKLSVVHDYRNASAQRARVLEAETFDLRLARAGKPALYVAGRPVSGQEARKQNFGPVGTVVTVAVIVAAVVGVYYISRMIDDSGEE
jgi:hypothetical protein